MNKADFKKFIKECVSEVLEKPLNEDDKLDEMTGTSAVQGFYGKNWVDPDPERKKMKSIAAKSVGGKVS